MSNKLLLPNKFKIVGWCLFIPATILGIILTTTGFEINWLHANVFAVFSDFSGSSKLAGVIQTNLTNTVIGVLFIIGAMFVGFSKEKREDEFIANLRLSSLLWAVWVNYILLLLAFLFVYGSNFLTVMIYNMFTVLIIFILRFNYILYKNFKTVSDEK
jgi:small-conductance mechanosensitive channel